MSGKGIQAQQRYNQRVRRIREGKEKPMKYTMTLKQALKAAEL